MKRILWVEYQRLFRNKKLYIAMAISVLIVVLQVLFETVPWVNGNYGNYPLTVFEKWIGTEQGSVFPMLYFMLTPILIAFPYGGALLEDMKSGYIKNICTRVGKKQYLLAKYIVVFTSGTFAVLPLSAELRIDSNAPACDNPIQPSTRFFSISALSMIGELFYQNPYLYLLLYLLLDIVFWGLLATLSLAITWASDYSYVVVLAPFLCCMLLYGVKMISRFKMVAPTVFLAPSQSPEANFIVILIEAVLLLAAGGGYYYVGTKKKFYKTNLPFLELFLIAGIVFWLRITNYLMGKMIQVSQADCLLFVSEPAFKIFIITPLFLFALSKYLREEERIQIILRKKSRIEIWKDKILQVLEIAVVFTVSISLITMVTGWLMKLPLINWDQKYSVYWMRCRKDTISLPYQKVAVYFILTLFMVLLVTGMLFAFCSLMSSNFIIGWLVCIGSNLAAYEINLAIEHGMFIKLLIDWPKWRHISITEGMIQGIFYMIVLSLCGGYYIKKKGFYCEK